MVEYIKKFTWGEFSAIIENMSRLEFDIWDLPWVLLLH